MDRLGRPFADNGERSKRDGRGCIGVEIAGVLSQGSSTEGKTVLCTMWHVLSEHGKRDTATIRW